MDRQEPFIPIDIPALADYPPPAERSDRRGMVWPVLLSLVLHGGGLTLLLALTVMPRTLLDSEQPRRSVQIRIVPAPLPASSLIPTSESIPVQVQAVETATATSPLPGEQSIPQPATEEPPAAPRTLTEPVVVSNDQSITVPVSGSEPDTEIVQRPAPDDRRQTLQLPSISQMRELLKDINSENDKAMSPDDCNRLQKENALITCSSAGSNALSPVERNVVYDYFNPRSDPRRSAASVSIIAAQGPAVQERMRAEGVDAALGDFLLQQERMIDQDYRGTTPSAAQGLSNVLNIHNRTHEMIKRAMGN
jgi:hypothetical protein